MAPAISLKISLAILGFLLLTACMLVCGCVNGNNGDSVNGMGDAGDGSGSSPTPQGNPDNTENTGSAGTAQSSAGTDTGTGADAENNAYAGGADIAADTKVYPVLVPDAAYEGKTVRRTFTTKFEKSQFTIDFDVDMALLKGARNADKSLGRKIAKESPEVQYKFYRSYFEGMENSDFFDALIKQLRYIKITERLSDEEYLEYLVTFVQQIPYNSPEGNTRFPVEVIYDGMGDCDEKSMLLMGLLEKSGYDTALLLFPKLGHAVCGIKIVPQGDVGFTTYSADDGRKYLYIEATTPYYIGLYPDAFANTDVLVIPLSDGGMPYTKYNYVAYIVDSKKKIEKRIDFFKTTLDGWYDELEEMKYKLINYKQYYSTQLEYDTAYQRYKNRVDEYNRYFEYYQKNIEVWNEIVDRPYDVEGVRRTIYNSKVNDIEY
ncbi:MAG: hypothetical protein J6X83_05345 [Methanomicrobium sp.]|nr:hypothetical protein [Methanomicrobium sp.]